MINFNISGEAFRSKQSKNCIILPATTILEHYNDKVVNKIKLVVDREDISLGSEERA